MSLSIVNKIQELAVYDANRKLYDMLIQQINKDLNLCGIDWENYLDIGPSQLYEEVKIIITKLLIGNSSSDIRTLLYRIDVSEKALRQIDILSPEEITNLVLEREMQKIWLKLKYSNS